MKLTKIQRSELRAKFGGRCAYCGCELPEKGWHADHIEAVIRELEIDRKAREQGLWRLKQTGKAYKEHLDTLDNLYPACAPCNLFKATYSIEGFRKEIALQVERARSYSVNFRTAERFGLVSKVDSPVIFYFEKYTAPALQEE